MSLWSRAGLVVGSVGLLALGCGTRTGPPAGAGDPVAGPTAVTSRSLEPSGSAAPVELLTALTYYVRDTPMGPRLASEVRQVRSDRVLHEAVAAVMDPPQDPDYRTLWPRELHIGAVSDFGDVVQVDLGEGADLLPSSVDAPTFELAVQQVAHTVRSVLRRPVRVAFAGGHRVFTEVFGVDVRQPIAPGPEIETLALMQVEHPHEGALVGGAHPLRATGRHSGFEGTVWWEVLDGSRVVREGALVAGGLLDDQLTPWEVEIDLRDLPPGEYTFVAGNDDPSGGTEGMGTSEETRRIVVVEGAAP